MTNVRRIGGKQQEAITVRAVLRYAAELRTTASRVRAADPWASTYEIKDDSARVLCSKKAREREEAVLAKNPGATAEEVAEARAHGPADALDELKARAKLRERTYREKAQADKQRDEKFAKFQRKRVERERRARALNLSPGRRIDDGLASLQMVATATATARFDPRITGEDQDHGAVMAALAAAETDARETAERMHDKVMRVVNLVEDEIDRARRRMVEDKAA